MGGPYVVAGSLKDLNIEYLALANLSSMISSRKQTAVRSGSAKLGVGRNVRVNDHASVAILLLLAHVVF